MSEKSELLYKLMLRKGYPEEFSRLICAEMNTDFTAEKMMSFIGGAKPTEINGLDTTATPYDERDHYVSGEKKRLEDIAMQ